MTTSPVDLQGVSGGKDTKNIPNGEKKVRGKRKVLRERVERIGSQLLRVGRKRLSE